MPRWRALVSLMLGVLLFCEPVWNRAQKGDDVRLEGALLGIVAVLIEVSLSGFSSIYFEKVIKVDTEQLGIWERNFQLALSSVPIYLLFIAFRDPEQQLGQGWSLMALSLSVLGASGGMLVALSIKYGDSVLKTLATTAAIILSSVIDHIWLGGVLTPIMCIAGVQVIVAICDYTFDSTPVLEKPTPEAQQKLTEEILPLTLKPPQDNV